MNELIYKTEIDPETQKTNLWFTKGESLGGGINQDIRINLFTLPQIKWITKKDLLYSTGNSTQYPVIPIWEKNLKKSGYMFMYN